ncbi:MAG TPA: NUDIX domain-containing protein [Microlunatus sp.]|nr:NUDIX domain-containing protein [Microlunatus sp.]
MTRARAACIVFDHDNAHVLLMRRFRDGQHYYVVPGGGIEPGETAREACLRELTEETSLRATQIRLTFTSDHDGARTAYFLIEDAEGVPRIGGPEADRNSPTNQYELRWVALHDLASIALRPVGAVTAITAAHASPG